MPSNMLRWLTNFRKQLLTGQYPPDTPINSIRYAVIDTEFTSRDQRSNRLLSVGAVMMEGPSIRMGEQFYRVLNPGVDVPSNTVLVHKLRPLDIESGEAPERVLGQLREHVAGAVLVGHFARIDVEILRKEMKAIGQFLENPYVCTAQVHRWLLRQGQYSEDLFHRMENVDLASLAKIYDIEFREAHHALDDAFVTARLWQKLIYQLEKRGVQTLAELVKVGAP